MLLRAAAQSVTVAAGRLSKGDEEGREEASF
jgi:hypothetical protein